jgi:hypothetical protein
MQTFSVVGTAVSITEMTGHGVEMAIVPRAAMETVARNRDLMDHRRWGRTGIYLLIGPPGQPWRVYVGSAADILDRTRNRDHWEEKDWWMRAVLIWSDGLGPGQHEQLERIIGVALRAADTDLIQVETQRFPAENTDWAVPQAVRRAVLPAVETVLHFFGLYVDIEDPTDSGS